MHEELDKFCPNCTPIYHKKNQTSQVGIRLYLVVDNYSGCGIDHYKCPNCEQTFQVSYKVDEILPIN